MADGDGEAAAHCPTCGAEHRAGYETCADDGTPLVAGPASPAAPPSPRDAPEPPRSGAPTVAWTAVAEFRRQEEARLLAGRLQAEGIPARTFPEARYDYYGPGTSAMLGRPYQVLVPEHVVAEARAVIDGLAES